MEEVLQQIFDIEQECRREIDRARDAAAQQFSAERLRLERQTQEAEAQNRQERERRFEAEIQTAQREAHAARARQDAAFARVIAAPALCAGVQDRIVDILLER